MGHHVNEWARAAEESQARSDRRRVERQRDPVISALVAVVAMSVVAAAVYLSLGRLL